MKKVLLGVLLGMILVSLVACTQKQETQITPAQILEPSKEVASEPRTITIGGEEFEEGTYIPKSEQTGTAGSSIPIKDNPADAEYYIKVAMQELLKKAYGDNVHDARFYVEKIYTAEEEQEIEPLKEENLGPNEVAFEIKYELRPAPGVDPIQFTAGTGDYDEETGWVKEKYNVGILRPTESGEPKYEITDFGTGW